MQRSTDKTLEHELPISYKSRVILVNFWTIGIVLENIVSGDMAEMLGPRTNSQNLI